jgi:hypothetical protein
MSKLLKIVALRKGMMKEFEVLNEWNKLQNDSPLNNFNNNWLKNNFKSKDLLCVAERVKSDLGFKFSLLLYETLSIYGNIEAKRELKNCETNSYLRES